MSVPLNSYHFELLPTCYTFVVLQHSLPSSIQMSGSFLFVGNAILSSVVASSTSMGW